MYRKALILLLSMIIGVSFVSSEAYAKKSFWESMFGWMGTPTNEPDPAQTLQAPFAYGGDESANNGQIERSSSNPVPLKHAHTNESEIGKWLMTAISETMSYQVGKDGDIVEKNKEYFAPSGQKQLQKFLQDNNIAKVMESGRYNIRSFVRENPLLLNSGNADNRFRWLYEVPVMVSYMDAEGFDYKEDDPVNQHMLLTIQVGRVVEANNDFDVLIETWSGKSQKIDKN